MALRTKLADLSVVETSGVDHPAHLHEGWLVLKSTAETNTIEGETVDLEVTSEPMPVEAVEVVEIVVDQDLRKEMGDLRKELSDLRKEKERLESERELEKAVDVAHAWGILPQFDAKEFAPILVALRKSAPEAAAKIETVLSASAVALKESNILKEVGTASNSEGSSDAWAQIEVLANDLVADGKAPSFAKAVSTVAATNMDLYTRYLEEKGL